VWKELNYGAMRDKEKQLVVSEVNILRELRHPFIVRLVVGFWKGR
jgi:NIMA (never in mitosis gene a)-related kinase 2